jgi:hypothetical protein
VYYAIVVDTHRSDPFMVQEIFPSTAAAMEYVKQWIHPERSYKIIDVDLSTRG